MQMSLFFCVKNKKVFIFLWYILRIKIFKKD